MGRDRAFWVVAGPLIAWALLVAILSLRWRMAHDAALMMYLAHLIDVWDQVPYRDFYGVNLPGSYGASVLIGRIFGYGDIGFRLADLLVLGGIGAATVAWLGRLDRRAAVTAVALFTAHYLGLGQSQSLQRDYILLLPVALSLVLAVGEPDEQQGPSRRLLFRSAIVGLLFGLAAVIKPHAAIGLPVILLYMAHNQVPGAMWRRFFWLAAAALTGFSLPLVVTLAYLGHTAALAPFLAIVTDYWPLFGARTGNHETIAGARRALYLALGYLQQGRLDVWYVPAGIGAYGALAYGRLGRERQRLVWLTLAMAVAYNLYPLPAGQFFTYHWLPFYYFLACLAGLVWLARPLDAGRVARAVPVAALLLAMVTGLRPPGEARFQLTGRPPPPPKNGRVDAIATYLDAHLIPGERVQPLDWTGGTLHAMLLARAQVATSFVYDFHFYHHVSEPTIQSLRERFIRELTAAPPQFIIEVTAVDKPWVHGEDTTRDFPALRQFIAASFRLAEEGDGYIIYERLDP